MPVPEATMYKDRLLAADESQVGTAHHRAMVLPIAVTERPHQSPKLQLGRGVAGFHPAHALAPLRSRQRVHHSPAFPALEPRSRDFAMYCRMASRTIHPRLRSSRCAKRSSSARSAAPTVTVNLPEASAAGLQAAAACSSVRITVMNHDTTSIVKFNLLNYIYFFEI